VHAGAGLTPHSAVPLLRRTLWHPTMHAWCTPGQRASVLAVLVAELRSDRQDEETAPLPLLVHDRWLLILEFVPRRSLGLGGLNRGGGKARVRAQHWINSAVCGITMCFARRVAIRKTSTV